MHEELASFFNKVRRYFSIFLKFVRVFDISPGRSPFAWGHPFSLACPRLALIFTF